MTRNWRHRWSRAAVRGGLLIALAFATASCHVEELVAFELPPESKEYRLTMDYENIHTEWMFHSSHVATDQTPDGTLCAGTIEEGPTPCRAEPLIFLGYDASLGLDNTVRGGRAGKINVSAYYQAEDALTIEGLKLWTSTDGGDSWQPARVRARGGGEYVATVKYPPDHRTSGTVGLRAEAWDVDGNRVEQTILDAYGLRARQ